jgi:hypothetical protein
MSEPLSREREGGIRLYRKMMVRDGDQFLGPAMMLDDLLAEIDRLRQELRGVRTQLSVHERHGRVVWASMFSEGERAMMRFALEEAQERIFERGGFTEEDRVALTKLMEWFG